MADNERPEDFEANETDLAVFPAANAQGYLYEPRINQANAQSDDSSSEESSSDGSDYDDARVGNVDWCDCGQCVPMPTYKESTCCKEIAPVEQLIHDLDLQCISAHPGFEGNCLNRYVIETSFYEFLDGYGHVGDDEPIHELYRYIAYRRFTRWVWHKLGRGVRRVIPSCAVHKIRENWPSEEYTGFRYRRYY